jgi:predicted DNA-binding protein (UPF0251 family)
MDAMSNPIVTLQQQSGDYALSISQAAKIARVSSRTMWRLIEKSQIKSIRASERRRIIMASELARHLSEGFREGAAA